MTSKFKAVFIAAVLAIAASACGGSKGCDSVDCDSTVVPEAGAGGESGSSHVSPAEAGEAGERNSSTGGSGSTAGSPSTGGNTGEAGSDDGGTGNTGTGGTASSTVGGADSGTTGGATGEAGSPNEGGSAPIGGASPTTGGNTGEAGGDDGGTGNVGTGGTDGGASPTTGGTSQGGSAPEAGNGGEGGEVEECVPSERPSASGTMGTMGCGTWTFHPYETTYETSYKGVSLGNGEILVVTWNPSTGYETLVGPPDDLSPTDALPGDVAPTSAASDGSSTWLAGETEDGEAVVFRLENDGTWTPIVDGISQNGNATVTAAWVKDGDLIISVLNAAIAPGPCQGPCPITKTTTIYKLVGDEWQAMAGGTFPGSVDGLWGSGSTDMFAVGFTGEGDDRDALFYWWDGCEWRNRSNTLPADITNLNDIDGADGEVVIVGDADNTGVRLVTTDLEDWERSNMPANVALNAVWVQEEGSTLGVGINRSTLESYSTTRNGGIWGEMNFLPAAEDVYHLTDVFADGSAGNIVAVSEIGVWTNICQ